MTQYTRNEVLEAAKRLAEMIANTEEIERFKIVEAKINENQKVQRLITKIKTLQKQAVNLQAYEKKAALKIVEDTIDEAQEELDTIPIVEEFQDIQGTVNNVLQLVSGTIAREVTNHIIESTDGDLLEGKTGATKKNETSCSDK